MEHANPGTLCSCLSRDLNARPMASPALRPRKRMGIRETHPTEKLS